MKIIWISANPFAPIQAIDQKHILIPDLEIEDVGVALDAVLLRRLGNRHNPSLNHPAQGV